VTEKSILIVDDSEVFLSYFTTMLRRMGYEKIIPARDGEDALRIITLQLPDVVLLDIEMPGSSTILKHIKGTQMTSQIPVIMLTTAPDIEADKQCEKTGCFGYLTKPVKVTHMNDMINRCISYEGGKRRKFLRTTLQQVVDLTYEGKTEEYYAVSLSEGGIYIRKVEPFPVGTKVEIALPIKKDVTLNLKGKVIYVNYVKVGSGMAIAFDDLRHEDSEMLQAYILAILTGDIVEKQEEPVIKKDDRISYILG
jgi:CheY-like chemotaxis protein